MRCASRKDKLEGVKVQCRQGTKVIRKKKTGNMWTKYVQCIQTFKALDFSVLIHNLPNKIILKYSN